MRVCCRTCAKALAGLEPISPSSSRSLKNERGITESGFGFRGFRHTFMARLSRKRVGLEEIAPITGHVRNEYVPWDAYIDTVLPAELPAEMVETLAKFAPPPRFAVALYARPVPASVPQGRHQPPTKQEGKAGWGESSKA